MDKPTSTFRMARCKPRDFRASPRMLKMLSGENYDRVEDINQLQLNVHDTITKLKKQWKTSDMEQLKAAIKKSVITELFKLEERKHVRREQAEIVRKRKAKAEELRDQREASMLQQSMLNRSGVMGASPTRGGGVGFLDRSQTSSPTKYGSPGRRAITGAESAADTQSVMTGALTSKSPTKGAFSLLGGGGGIQGIIA